MSELGSIEKIDAARAELARHGITLESFETMRARIDALEECLREFLAWADAPIGPHEQLAKVIDKARALLEGK